VSELAYELVVVALGVFLGTVGYFATEAHAEPRGTPDYMPRGMGSVGKAWAKEGPERALIWLGGQVVGSVALTTWIALSEPRVGLLVVVVGITAFEVYQTVRCVPRALRAMRGHSTVH
jgi:hypothetical protein